MTSNVLSVIRLLTRNGYTVTFTQGMNNEDISMRILKVHNNKTYVRQEENVLSRYSPGIYPSAIIDNKGNILNLSNDSVIKILSDMKKQLDKDIRGDNI